MPAVGRAIEDLQYTDQEEREDRLLSRQDITIDTIAESPNRELYKAAPSLPRKENPFFRYFVDGSRKSYFIGTAIEQERTSPIQLAQVGAAAVARDPDGSIHNAVLKKNILLLLAKGRLSDEVWGQLNKLAVEKGFVLVDIRDKDPLSGEVNEAQDLRNRAADRANWGMRQMELDVLNEVRAKDQNGWLILDGSIRFEKLLKSHLSRQNILGVIKSFSKDPVFQIGRGPKGSRLNITMLLAKLPAAHRTCAFVSQSGDVAFWYVRLREQGQVDYPLMGVIKVEIPMPEKGEALDSNLIDLISSALIGERHVTPHGRDVRWHAHLYPIYLAEQVIKNAFVSNEILRAGICWPLIARPKYGGNE
jgi:hypothetical protein